MYGFERVVVSVVVVVVVGRFGKRSGVANQIGM